MNSLIGDIGGTKTILAVFSTEQGPHDPLIEKTFDSSHYDSLESIIRIFLSLSQYPIDLACFGVAGPVIEGSARITNLTWTIESRKIKDTFNFSSVVLINDMVAVANSISVLEQDDIFTLRTGKPMKEACIGILAPGTGLGECFLTYENGSYVANPSEGSHASFAPVNDNQIKLLQYAHGQGHEHVSFERVCSGGLGVPLLYGYLKSTGRFSEPGWLAEKLSQAADPTPVIINAAVDKDHPCEIAEAVLDLFVEILGAEAGNLALKVLATGGIYLGGGIPPRIVHKLSEPMFLEAMNEKGRFKELLSNIPVHVILNPKAGLLGTAFVGLRTPAS
jgi:glucokinase